MSRVLVKNHEKERAKVIIKNDIKACQTELYDVSNKLSELVSLLSNTESGSIAGYDQKLIDPCKQAIAQISQALTSLSNGIGHADQINTDEWVEDNAKYY